MNLCNKVDVAYILKIFKVIMNQIMSLFVSMEKSSLTSAVDFILFAVEKSWIWSRGKSLGLVTRVLDLGLDKMVMVLEKRSRWHHWLQLDSSIASYITLCQQGLTLAGSFPQIHPYNMLRWQGLDSDGSLPPDLSFSSCNLGIHIRHLKLQILHIYMKIGHLQPRQGYWII